MTSRRTRPRDQSLERCHLLLHHSELVLLEMGTRTRNHSQCPPPIAFLAAFRFPFLFGYIRCYRFSPCSNCHGHWQHSVSCLLIPFPSTASIPPMDTAGSTIQLYIRRNRDETSEMKRTVCLLDVCPGWIVCMRGDKITTGQVEPSARA